MSTADRSGPARVDAHDKVRGATRYAADDARRGMLHAMLAVAEVGRGTLTELDVAGARAVSGVRLVLTHEDMAGVRSAGYLLAGGYAFQSLQPMLSTQIAYRGQPIALVVADSLEAAIEGAQRVRGSYAQEPFAVTLDAPGAEIVAQQDTPLPGPLRDDKVAGNADAALAAAAVTVDQTYIGPPQHQNPMELVATVAEWRDGMLTIREGTQNIGAVKHGLALQLGIRPEQVRVVSPTVGGAFGQKVSLQAQTVIVALAARLLRRPVKLVVPRSQLFEDASFRPAVRQRMRLGADRSGRMVAAIHDVEHQTSRFDLYPLSYAEESARLHGISNFRARETFVRTDVQTPGYMRAPYEHIGAFAMESAVDELAVALGQDPVALRIANDATVDALTGKPLSSRHLAECLQVGAQRFGWSERTPAPRSMRRDDGTLVGWGVAAGTYPSSTAAAIAVLRATDDGALSVSAGGHEMGQGLRNAVSAAVSEVLGVPVEDITTVLGDTFGPPAHLTAGSSGTATAVPAVRQAAIDMLEQLRALDPRAGRGRTPGQVLRAAGRPVLEVEARHLPPGLPPQAFGRLAQGLPVIVGPEYPEFVAMSYIAHFVEVNVEPTTRRVRVPRVVSIADCGRVMSPRTAHSQVRGGVVWGIGAALREVSEVDPRFGGFLNKDLAEYVIPVNADINDIDVGFIGKPDPLLNDAGVKSLGEVVMVGVAPAIANAIWHATGRRFRRLPIRIEDLLE